MKFGSKVLSGILALLLCLAVGSSPSLSGAPASLDVDSNGQADALTDGMLILRYLFGFKGSALINGVLAVDAQRTEPAEILAYLDPLRATMLDVDCNGKADAFTDGMLIARFLMGFTGTNLTSGVLDPAGCRNTPEQVIAFLTGFVPGTNAIPEAHAGPDQTVAVSTIVQLDGSQSIDQNGDPLTYAWLIVQKPQSSSATLLNPQSLTPSFIADAEGDFEVQLIVNDGIEDSLADTVIISTANSAPVAHAGHDQHVEINETVQLNGSHSYDADGNELSFSWNIVSQPEGSFASLSDPQAVLPTITIDTMGSFEIELTVDDGTQTSAASSITLSTKNLIPVAHAGPDQTIGVSQTVTLDGHRSFDPNGDLVTFDWAIISAPQNSTAELSDTHLVNPTFVADVGGTYVVQLLVNDGSGLCKPDTVIIRTGNVTPVANAGQDQSISTGDTPVISAQGSTDINGDLLTFEWALIQKPQGSGVELTDSSTIIPTLSTIDLPGDYIAQLKVRDGDGLYNINTVLLTTENVPPMANAGMDQTAIPGQSVLLDSLGSTDANGDPLSELWELLSKPEGSTATLDDPSSPTPTLEIDQEGTYVGNVSVNDGLAQSKRDAVVISTTNSRPIADAGEDQDVLLGVNVQLDGGNSTDADGNLLAFRWDFLSLPDGSNEVLSNADTANPEFMPTVPGLYLAQLQVDDDALRGEPSTVLINVSMQQPAPLITDFSPKEVNQGQQVNIIGENLIPFLGGATQVTLAQQGGGTIDAPVTSSTPTSLAITVPTSAATGHFDVKVLNETATSQEDLIIVPSSTISAINVEPASANVSQGESVTFAVILESQDGFSQFAALEVSGLPPDVIAEFDPPQIAEGQAGLLHITAPINQPIAITDFMVTASANVDGIDIEAEQTASLTVQPVTTTFMGRAVVSDALQTPLAGVTISMLGQDGSGNATGCAGQAISDAAGNFSLTNLPGTCVGGQLVRFDGRTATSPAGEYARVDKFYELTLDQVTKPPVLVHLPRIDTADTVLVEQNAAQDQIFTFPSIPNLSVTVYAGTVFTLEDGSQPNPFPLQAVEIALDRMPGGNLPPSDEGVVPMLVGFQPANTTASQPAAVFYPNTLNTPPGTSVPLLTLDPTKGIMVEYGTGTISEDGLQVIPDLDPANPGKRFGLTHLGWHSPVTAIPDQVAKGGFGDDGGEKGCPVSLASGLQVLVQTDLVVGGQRGRMAIQRNYRAESNLVGPFGIGTFHNYSHRVNIGSTTSPDSRIFTLIMPDGNQIPFTRQGPRGDRTWINETVPAFRGSVMTLNAQREATVKLKDCSTLHFVPTNTPQGSHLESVTDANGNTIALIRDPQAPVRINEIIDPVGRKMLLEYNANGRITKVTDPIGRIVTYTYGAQETLETVTNPEGGVTRYEYDAQNRMSQITDPRNVVVAQITYGINGRVIQEIQADGGVLKFDYTFLNPDVANSPVLETRFTDALDRTSVYRYNTQGFLVQVTDPLGQTTVFEREPGTNLLLSRKGTATCDVCGDPRQGDITNAYDANGNLSSIKDALNHTTSFTYDPVFNKITSLTDPLNHQAQMTYDDNGNLLTSTDQNGEMTTFSYNEFGLLKQITDPLDEKTTLEYDEEGNLIEVRDPLDHVTTFEYDAISRRVATIDALGRRTTLEYDNLNRIVSTTDALGHITTFAYDEVGNLLGLTDAKNHMTNFAYDVMNRLVTRTDPFSQIERFEYDLAGNLIQYTDRRNQVSRFTYDELDRLVSERYEDGNVVSRGYNQRGRLAAVASSRVLENPSPFDLFKTVGFDTFLYDAVGRLTREAKFSGSLEYAYDARGQMLSRQALGRPVVNHSYDPAGNLLSAVMPEAGVTMAYDARNQLATITRTNGVNSDYAYDPAGRVLSIVHANGPNIIDTQTYAYDAVGNRINHSTGLAQPLITQPAISTFDENNRLLTRNGTTYTYDENGNRETETGATGTKTYTWDARNRLVKLEGPQNTVDFQYDFLGTLFKQVTTDNSGTATRSFQVDKLTNVVSEFRSDGTSLAMLTGQNIDSHLAIIDSTGTTEYGLTDGLNSTVVTVDQTGTPSATLNYEPYGETTTAGTYPFQFTGRVPVSENLYYYRARFYDPHAGQFISEDPIGFGSGNINHYGYVGNNPVNSIDPFGLITDIGSTTERLSANGDLLETLIAIQNAINEFNVSKIIDIAEFRGLIRQGFAKGAVFASNVLSFAGITLGVIDISINNQKIDQLIRELDDIEAQIRAIQAEKRRRAGLGNSSEPPMCLIGGQ